MVLMGLIASSLVLSQVISYGTTWVWLNAWSWEFMYPLLETSGTQESAIIRNKISAVWIKIFCVFTRKSHMYLEELLAVFAYDAQKTYYTVVVSFCKHSWNWQVLSTFEHVVLSVFASLLEDAQVGKQGNLLEEFWWKLSRAWLNCTVHCIWDRLLVL